jgi:anti-sigma B factor antagonist
MALEIQLTQTLGKPTTAATVIKLNGSLDTATAPELERKLTTILAAPVQDLVFDLAGLRFVSSAGLRVFAGARKAVKSRGGQTSFIRMQPQIAEVFAIIQSLPGIAIFQNEAELDEYLAARQHARQSEA